MAPGFESCDGVGGGPVCGTLPGAKVFAGIGVALGETGPEDELLGGDATTGAESGSGATMGPGAGDLETLLGMGTPTLDGEVDGGEVDGSEVDGSEVDGSAVVGSAVVGSAVVGAGKLAGGEKVGGAGPIKLGAAIDPLEDGVDDGATVDGTAQALAGRLGADGAAVTLPYQAGRATPTAEGPTEYAEYGTAPAR